MEGDVFFYEACVWVVLDMINGYIQGKECVFTLACVSAFSQGAVFSLTNPKSTSASLCHFCLRLERKVWEKIVFSWYTELNQISQWRCILSLSLSLSLKINPVFAFERGCWLVVLNILSLGSDYPSVPSSCVGRGEIRPPPLTTNHISPLELVTGP